MITALRKCAAAVCAGTIIMSSISALGLETGGQADADAAAVLLSIGVTDSVQKSSDIVSREEFAYHMSKLFNVRQIAEPAVSPFMDVSKSNKYYKEICWIYDMGCIVGDENSMFEPKRSITFGEAVKITVRLLGYGIQAERAGGYPFGYISQARAVGAVSDSTIPVNDVLTYETLYRIMLCTLEAEPYENIDEDSPAKADEPKTLMYLKYAVKEIDGIVTSNGITSINGADICKRDYISIDGIAYCKSENAELEDLLGYRVKAYVKDDAWSGSEVFYLYPYKTAEITLEADEIISVEDGTLFYSEEGKSSSKKLRLDKAIDYIYNFKAAEITSYSDIIPTSGHAEFIDNDDDGYYEIVKVFERINVQLTYADITDSKLYNTKRGIIIDLSDNDVEYELMCNGEIITLKDLEQDDILTAYISRDKSYAKILAAKDSFEGMVTSIYEESGRIWVEIEDRRYKIAEDCGYIPEAGYKGTFFLNAYGEIAHIERMFGECETFGYLLNVMVDYDNDDEVLVKLFTTNGFVEILKCAERVMVNGVSKTDKKSLYSSLCIDTAGNPSEMPVEQPLRYKTNNNGQIMLIDTLASVMGGDEDRFVLSKPKTTITHKANGVFSGDFAVNSDTAAILVPSDTSDTKGFMMFNPANFQSDKSYVVEAYNFDETRIPEFLIVYENINAQTKGIMYVSKLENGINEDDEVVAKITGYVDGALMTINTADSSAYDKLSCGDVIRYFKDGDGSVKSFEIWYDASEDSVGDAGGTVTSNEFIVLGKVMSANNDIVLIQIDDATKYVYDMQSINIYKLNKSDKEIRQSTWQEVKSEQSFGSGASLMFIYSNGGFTRSAMIIE